MKIRDSQFRSVNLPSRLDILLAAIHRVSKMNTEPASRTMDCLKLAQAIGDTEQREGHSRTILVGDLNMNPFETGIVAAGGLHAVMCRTIAQKDTRKVQGMSYKFFYNPMWSLLGDASQGPPGTYHYARAEQEAYFWNMFDQVLIRPDLLSRFRNEDLQILDSVGRRSLLTATGIPDSNQASDHLPILFKLRL